LGVNYTRFENVSPSSGSIVITTPNQNGAQVMEGIQLVPKQTLAISLANTAISVTASSALDMWSASHNHTLGALTLADGVTLTVQNAQSVSFGDFTGTGASAIAASCPITFSGTLTVGASLSINNDLNLTKSSGNSAALTINGAGGGAGRVVDITGTGKNLTIAAGGNLSLAYGAGLSAGTYRLFAYTGSLTGTFANDAYASAPTPPAGFAWHQFSGNKWIEYDATGKCINVQLDALGNSSGTVITIK
jgi:hypothetical protein